MGLYCIEKVTTEYKMIPALRMIETKEKPADFKDTVYSNTERTEKTYLPGVFSLEEAVFIAKVEASLCKDPSEDVVYLKEEDMTSKIIRWDSQMPDRGLTAGCASLLASAETTTIYDNAVDLDLRLGSCDFHYKLTAYCFYDNEECKKPVIGLVVVTEKNGEEHTLMLSEEERESLQQVLDRQEFPQYQFGREYQTEEEEKDL